MINFIINNPFAAIMLAVIIFCVIAIFVLVKESKRLSKKKPEPAQKTAEPAKTEEETTEQKTEETTQTTDSTDEAPVVVSEETEEDDEVSYIADGQKKKKKKYRKYRKGNQITEEEIVSRAGLLESQDKRKILKIWGGGVFTFVSREKRYKIPKYFEQMKIHERTLRKSFVRKSYRANKFATRNKMLQVPEEIPQVQEQKPVELTPEEQRKQRYSKYFDKSRRLSKYVSEEDFDNLFDSHISEQYMNINTKKHLNVGKKFNKSLYSMASYVLAHGEIKITDDQELSIKSNRKKWLKRKSKEEYKRMMSEGQETDDFMDEEIRQDEAVADYINDYYNDELDGEGILSAVNLDPQNMLKVDSVLHRDRNRNKTGRLGKR